MSVSYQRLSLYGHRVERNIVAAGEAFYANVTHDHVAEEAPYYTQFDAVKPPSATQGVGCRRLGSPCQECLRR